MTVAEVALLVLQPNVDVDPEPTVEGLKFKRYVVGGSTTPTLALAVAAVPAALLATTAQVPVPVDVPATAVTLPPVLVPDAEPLTAPEQFAELLTALATVQVNAMPWLVVT